MASNLFNRPAADVAVDFLNARLPVRFPHASPSSPVPAVVFDMDGTLANVADLAHEHLSGKDGRKKDWAAFHNGSLHSPPNQWVVDDARRIYGQGTAVLIVTARMSDYCGVTSQWLDNQPVPRDRMYMRRSGDFRPDRQVKTDIVAQILADGFLITHAYDDNPAVLALWADIGIPTTIVPGHLNQK